MGVLQHLVLSKKPKNTQISRKNQKNPPIQWCDVHCPQAYPPPSPQQTMEKILFGGKWAQQVAKKHPKKHQKTSKKTPKNTKKHQKIDLLHRPTRHPPKWPVAGVFVRLGMQG